MDADMSAATQAAMALAQKVIAQGGSLPPDLLAVDASWDDEGSFVQLGVIVDGQAVCERFRLQGYQFAVDGHEFENAYAFAGLIAG